MAGIGLIGFGRVGRGLFRELCTRNSTGQVVCLAELNPTGRDTRESTANLAYLLAQDSTYGPFPGRVEAKATSLVVDGREIPVHFTPHPEKVDWEASGARVVVEASGDPQSTAEARGLLSRGVEKILLTRSAASADATLVRGLNLDSYDPAAHHLISCSTCTANALAPVLAVIHQAYSVRRCAVTTVHPALSGDTFLDAPASEFAAGRSGLSLRAVASEVARTTGQLLPQLQGRLTAMSLRVPTTAVNALVANISLVSPPGSAGAVEALLSGALEGPLQGVVALERGILGHARPAGDFLGDPHSALVDLNWLSLSGELLRLLIWHDNEYAYCCRVVDTLEVITGQL